MKGTLVLALFGVAALAFGGQMASERPKITGLDHVTFYTTAPEGVTHSYLRGERFFFRPGTMRVSLAAQQPRRYERL